MQFGFGIDINNKVVSYRPTIHSNSELFKKNKTEKAPTLSVFLLNILFCFLTDVTHSWQSLAVSFEGYTIHPFIMSWLEVE